MNSSINYLNRKHKKNNMKLSSSKKAQAQSTEEIMTLIIAMVIAVVVIMLELLYMIGGLKDNTFFEKSFLERDLANTIDSLYISPGNIVVDYDKDTKLFSFKFDKNSVNVYEKLDILHPDNIVYYFTPDKKTIHSTMELKPVFRDDKISEENLIEKVNLRFAKTDKRLQINKKESLMPNMNELECNEVENAQKFFVSYSKGFNDIKDIDDVKERNHAINYDVFVWYYSGSYDDLTKNTVKAFISSDVNIAENKRLACLILNQFLSKFKTIADENNLQDVTGVAIIPIDSWQMISQENYLAVLLEIGNKNIPEERNLWSNEDVKNAILEGIDMGVKSYG